MFKGPEDQQRIEDDDTDGSFSQERGPETVVMPCKTKWTLHVKVKKHASFPADRVDIKIRLQRIGYYTGWTKSTGSLAKTLSSDAEPISADFTGTINERYWLDATVEGDDWFNWTSERKDVWISPGEEKSVEIEVRPHLLLVSMSALGESPRARVQGGDCATTYGLTKTVTGADIRAVVGDDNLDTGRIDAEAMATNAATLANMLGFRAPPYFSVVDLNLSHQMTFFLACLAFHQHGKHRSKLVLNFDNHRDYAGSDSVTYDKWGAGFFQNAELLRDVIGADRVVYSILGEAQLEVSTAPLRGSVRRLTYSDRQPGGESCTWGIPLGSTHFRTSAPLVVATWTGVAWRLEHARSEIVDASFDEGDLEELEARGVLKMVHPDARTSKTMKLVFERLSGSHDPTTFREANQPLVAELENATAQTLDLNACTAEQILDERHLGDLSRTDVYVTVDRDVTQKSFTYWGDGFLACEEMRSAVDKCLTYLKAKGANLVGFDLCGLPDSEGKSAALGIARGHDPGEHEAEILEQARDDIAFFAQRVRAYQDG
jgi:hypothetical protein